MSEPARKIAAYEELQHVPENMTGQIIDGELLVTARPTRRHVHSASALGGSVIPPYQFGKGGGPGGWIIYDEPEAHFDERNIFVPDLAGWKKERLTTLPEEHRFTIPPDWVCEILSPNTARSDRIRKMRVFAQYGVSHAWLIDPGLMILEVFRLESGRWVVVGAHAGNEKVRAEPFLELELDLALLWIEEPPAD